MPESTSLNSLTSFKPTSVTQFFIKFGKVIGCYKFQVDHTWNSNETGVTTVQKARNVVALKRTKV